MALGFHMGTPATAHNPIVNAGYIYWQASNARWYYSYGTYDIDARVYTQVGLVGPVSTTTGVVLYDLAKGWVPSSSDLTRKVTTLKRCYYSAGGFGSMAITAANTQVVSVYSGSSSVPNQYFRDIADWE